jgi:hypothetical protein
MGEVTALAGFLLPLSSVRITWMVPIILANRPSHETTQMAAGKTPLNKVVYITFVVGGALFPDGGYSPPGGNLLILI